MLPERVGGGIREAKGLENVGVHYVMQEYLNVCYSKFN